MIDCKGDPRGEQEQIIKNGNAEVEIFAPELLAWLLLLVVHQAERKNYFEKGVSGTALGRATSQL